jgi:hypothetical protein
MFVVWQSVMAPFSVFTIPGAADSIEGSVKPDSLALLGLYSRTGRKYQDFWCTCSLPIVGQIGPHPTSISNQWNITR